jgi:hypothetical protein
MYKLKVKLIKMTIENREPTGSWPKGWISSLGFAQLAVVSKRGNVDGT